MITVLVPTLNRPERVISLLNSHQQHSKYSRLFFVISDKDTLKVIKGYDHLWFDAEYVGKINKAYKQIKTKYCMLGADDIEFSPDWDIRLMKHFNNPKINVVGGIDDWPISQSGVHTSHPVVRTSYFNLPLYQGYIHYMGDIELNQRAWKDNSIIIDKKVYIPHKHTVNKKAANDTTYQRSSKIIDKDKQLYLSRRHEFEVWDLNNLYLGKAILSKNAS
jgi:hypothetical protein